MTGAAVQVFGRPRPAGGPAGELLIGSTRIRRETSTHTVTTLHDGAVVHAVPHEDAAYLAHAGELGYGADTARMSYEHELLHTLLADWLGLDESPVLRAVADGTWQDGPASLGEEETAVLAIQRLCRSLGVELDVVRAGGPRVVGSAEGGGGPWTGHDNTGGEASMRS